MKLFPKHSRVVCSDGLPDRHVDQLEDGEAVLVLDVSARPDTRAIYVEDGDTGALVAYAIVGPHDSGDFLVFAAHVFVNGIGKTMLAALFGASKILGKPMRVHSNKISAMARAIGAPEFAETLCGNGLPQGVFDGQ